MEMIEIKNLTKNGLPSGNFFNNTANAVKISLEVKPVTIPLIPSSSQSFLFNAFPVIALT